MTGSEENNQTPSETVPAENDTKPKASTRDHPLDEEDRKERDRLDAINEDGKKVYRLKTWIRVLIIVLSIIILMLLCLFAATVIINFDESYPVRIGEDTGILSLDITREMKHPTSNIRIPVEEKLDNISVLSLPDDLDSELGGSKNGKNYVAYTFFLKNNASFDIEIDETIRLVSQTKHADRAARIEIFRDGVADTYAQLSAKGFPEYGTTAFYDEKTVYYGRKPLEAGQIVRYGESFRISLSDCMKCSTSGNI